MKNIIKGVLFYVNVMMGLILLSVDEMNLAPYCLLCGIVGALTMVNYAIYTCCGVKNFYTYTGYTKLKNLMNLK